ncbi:S8 family serine peptidase [Rugamonas sp. CCM 8940]|uniref:S8 family peptidase n=1 Tax=Rugamonas sp. CCM 8940 TaxID=2765359 RepID=UPI0018F6E94F|nr:S8 family serine peptidase [Rugamonas sp. CCM 8940]MBJ7309793.1 S8 family serine peptidase [Rugamonas sp. CCM 8940]
MKPSIQFSLLAASLAVASLAQAQSSGTILSSPFGAAPKAAAATVSKTQARAALSATAVAKADRAHLDRLLDSETNEFIVVFKDEAPARVAVSGNHAERLSMQQSAYQATRKRVRAELNSTDIEFSHEYKAMPWAYVRVSSRAALVKLINHADVRLVVENIKMNLNLAQSLPAIQQPEALVTGRAGAGTTVVVLDGGADISQAAFGCSSPGVPASCRIAAAIPIATGNFKVTPHGTNVAAIVTGVANGARVASVDISINDTQINLDSAARGMDWAIVNRDQYNIVAANMSFGVSQRFTDTCGVGQLGTGPAAAFVDAFARLRAARIAPVVAAGNDAYTNGVGFPACVSGAVVVGAIYDSNIPGGQAYSSCTDATRNANAVACFSNSSNLVSLFAPGANITAGGVTMAGTSQAAPHVAGALAVLRGANAAPTDSVQDGLNRLLAFGPIVTDPRNGVSKPRLNLFGALNGLAPDSSYRLVTQQVYLGYFGRPADPNGLYWFADGLKNAGAPTTIVELERAYATNATVRGLVENFSNSPESNALYGGDNTAFVTAIYRNLFNRLPDPGGLAFWVNAINNGSLTRGKAALSIMSGGMPNADGVTVTKKSEVAVNFTKSLDLAPEIGAYSNANATAKARAMLNQVTGATDVAAFQSVIDATIAQIVSGQ